MTVILCYLFFDGAICACGRFSVARHDGSVLVSMASAPCGTRRGSVPASQRILLSQRLQQVLQPHESREHRLNSDAKSLAECFYDFRAAVHAQADVAQVRHFVVLCWQRLDYTGNLCALFVTPDSGYGG